ncbi:MAG: ATP-binding cassette domain-containing protein [Desulfobacterales bacterium]|jgi:ATP-binding cassette subfamily F protein 3|nr:ATP-binding cassette domain-containing protein [Desulfobacterales bacterium]
MISVENLSKSYGGRVLFESISFRLNSRERVGLVARNGEGKTTLLRIIVGEEEADAGSLVIPRNYRIGYVRQHLEFTADTVLGEGIRGLPPHEREHVWKVEKILTGLGFSEEDLGRHPSEFSGGYQVRLNLAKVLVSEPDLLLLDEPTNYLDITSIRWVERFLLNWPHEVILVTHDRGFMDKLATHIVGLHRGKARKIAGDTHKYYAQIAQEEEIFEKTRINDERRRREVELFISRFRAKARLANLVQSRIKTLGKMEKTEKLEKLQELDFAFRSRPFKGKFLLHARDLAFGFKPERPLFKGVDFTVRAQDRIGIIGPNGRGKTTLLKLLYGALTPTSGEVSLHPAATPGFFEQTNVQSLVDSRTVEEEILWTSPDVGRQQARSICGAMLFAGDEALKKISVLSGGEKARVMLGKLLLTPVNLLLLDEPTNHLDMESCDALLAAIDSFQGAVVMVTHNEMFLHTLAERLIVFQGGNARLFEGGYQRFLETEGWSAEGGVAGAADNRSSAPLVKLSKKEARRRRSEIVTRRGREVRPLEEAIAELENRIESEEARMKDLNGEILVASRIGDGARIAELSRSLHACQGAIERHFAELEKLAAALDQKNAGYEAQLAQLGEGEALG